MAFEQKTSTSTEVRELYWNIFKFYLLLIAGFYFIFVLPGLAETENGELIISPELAIDMIQKAMYFVMASLLHLVRPHEHARTGAADWLMKIFVVTLLFAGNILGIILCALAWNELPKTITDKQIAQLEEPYIQVNNRWLIYIALVVLIVMVATRIVLWQIGGS